MLRLAAMEDEASQQKAAAMFEELGPQLAEGEAAALQKDLLPLLAEGIRSANPRVRKNSASLLATISTVREDGAALLAGVSPLLASKLKDEEESVRVSCAVALASQKPQPGPEALRALKTLAEAQLSAGEGDSLLLVTAISGLSECEKCADAEPLILRALDAKSLPEETRRRLILAIGEGQSRHAGVIVRLAQIAEKEEGRLRLAAVLALGNYGPAAKTAIPVLRALLEKAEDDGELEQALGSALKRILNVEE